MSGSTAPHGVQQSEVLRVSVDPLNPPWRAYAGAGERKSPTADSALSRNERLLANCHQSSPSAIASVGAVEQASPSRLVAPRLGIFVSVENVWSSCAASRRLCAASVWLSGQKPAVTICELVPSKGCTAKSKQSGSSPRCAGQVIGTIVQSRCLG